MADRTIATDGTGRATAHPDRATITIEVHGDGTSPGVARERATGGAAEIRDALSEAGAASGSVRRTDLRVRHRSDLFDAETTDSEYRATETITVDAAPEEAGEIVVAAADAGGRVEGVAFGVSEATRDELERRALREATADARERAEAIASVEGLSVGAVEEVTTLDGDGMQSIVDEALAGGSGVDFEPDPVSVTAEVEAVYAATRNGSD